MKVKFLFTLSSLLLVLSANSFAGVVATTTTYSSNKNTENRVYAGLVWTLQQKTSLVPDLSVGFRSLRTKSTDSVEGGDINLRIKLKDGVSFDSTRLSYVGGERSILGNVGVGYSYTTSSFLGTFGIQAPYSRVGSDYEFANKKFVPYLEILTVDKPSKVDEKVTITQNPI